MAQQFTWKTKINDEKQKELDIIKSRKKKKVHKIFYKSETWV